MALKSTIYKAALNLADIDRQVYGDYPLTLACHPSETEARMMLRLLAFALNAHQHLEFGRGISTDEEPDLWRRTLDDRIELWIDLGNPDEQRIRKAMGRAESVLIYAYGDRSTPVWWSKLPDRVRQHDKLSVYQVGDDELNALAGMASSNMNLQCSISEGIAFVSNEQGHNLQLQPAALN